MSDAASGGVFAGSGGTVEVGSGGTSEAGSGGTAEAGTGGVEPEEVPEIPDVDESALPEPVAEAGFIDVEGVRYRALMEYEEPNLESKSTRLFYSFVPADADAKRKPVFVFFNGGPGYTSMFLKAFGTGPATLDADDLDAAPKPNPSSFTSLGNLLYIDSRLAGFSYGLADDPSDEAARESSLQKGSANPTADAADFVRVVVRVLHEIAALRNNRIVLVGESYGGARAVLMLEILTEPDGHSDAALYADPTLEAELSAHFESVFPGVAPARLGRLARAKQFGWQVLIQPLVAGGAQYAAQGPLKEEKLERMAERAGVTLEELRADRCIDDRSRSRAWCEGIDAAVERTVTSPDLFELIMGMRPELVDGLPASYRSNAIRYGMETGGLDVPALRARLGELPPWDRYFSLIATAGPENTFNTSRSPFLPYFFTRVLRHTHTMITNAFWDSNIVTEAIVPALLDEDRSTGQPWVSAAEFVRSEGEEEPTRIRVRFSDQYPSPGAEETEIFFPAYPESGHMVTVGQPAKFRSDVESFLIETGLGE